MCFFCAGSFTGRHLNHELKTWVVQVKEVSKVTNGNHQRIGLSLLIIEMKRESIIRSKKTTEAKRSSLKNGSCCESLTGLYSPSGEVGATSVEKGLSNNRLQWTGTLKWG